MDAYLGELAALGTSLGFAFGSTLFTISAQRLGSVVVNRIRLLIALLFLGMTHWLLLGTFLPLDAAPEHWIWLSISGVVGLVIGDAFLFQAFVLVGPRISMLMMSLAPILAALQAWVFFGETLSLWQIIGILMTVAGVGWVVMEGGNKNGQNKDYLRGILFGLGGAIGQASGLILAKNGLLNDFSPISGNVIRMLAAATVMWGIAILQKQFKPTLRTLKENIKGVWLAFAASFFGPFIGVSLSLYSIQHTSIVVPSTLM
ncbi:MAG: DMT family transporter, partial [Anaerolineales bacterium]|nr:DMT family transporter [Anaerolineales bacterium]